MSDTLNEQSQADLRAVLQLVLQGITLLTEGYILKDGAVAVGETFSFVSFKAPEIPEITESSTEDEKELASDIAARRHEAIRRIREYNYNLGSSGSPLVPRSPYFSEGKLIAPYFLSPNDPMGAEAITIKLNNRLARGLKK